MSLESLIKKKINLIENLTIQNSCHIGNIFNFNLMRFTI